MKLTTDSMMQSTQELKSLGEYNREVSKELSKEILKRDPMRLKYGVMFSVFIIALVYSLLVFELPWYAKVP
ncbi:MAG: hypothetical protein HON90_02820, partial [Halobacteriovoraceae bacterium]|nr:hypothetical protein [Halobacteriovoraceae bacterium]